MKKDKMHFRSNAAQSVHVSQLVYFKNISQNLEYYQIISFSCMKSVVTRAHNKKN